MDIRTSQRWERAACFQKIADDVTTRPEIRAWFATQANLLRAMDHGAGARKAVASGHGLHAS